ncbi:SagB family peptide dehydrogenase [Halobium salinum]|uniref:SagB family peptide dehydrogenase n=1 Tax=Halobium salinum TaxID=1364940 RepID=A0ABD5PAU3_9EURY|nr:SagB family peptide dehydrogenase [Halobium salinum]
MSGLPAIEYHERTKHSPASVREGDFSLDFENKPLPFERYTSLPSRDLAGTIRPTQQPALAAVAEPTADPLAGCAQPRPGLDEDLLSQLAYYSTGIVEARSGDDARDAGAEGASTDWERLRERYDRLFAAASCTGKLYHVDCYFVCGDDAGVPAGVYRFDPPNYAFDVLRDGDFRGVLAEATGGYEAVANAPVTLVTTSTWWRNAWKYRERTFRHAFWDSGTLLANLLATAHGLDLRAEVVTGFADGPVADLLGVDPAEEAPLELVPVGQGSPAPEPPAVDPIDPETLPLSPDPVDYPSIYEAWNAGVLDEGGTAATWRERGSGRADAGDRCSPPTVAGDRYPLDPVDHASAAKTPLPRAIRRRRSCREYDRESLSFRKFSTILDRATRGAPMDVRGVDDPALSFVTPYLVVHDVESLPSGAYRYHVEDGELELLREGELREESAHLALGQEWAGTPAANVYFLANLERVVDRLGDRGYRVAQLEAAIAGGRFYLATYAHRGLGGTGLTFFDDPVTEFFGPAAARTTPMFLYVFGHAA